MVSFFQKHITYIDFIINIYLVIFIIQSIIWTIRSAIVKNYYDTNINTDNDAQKKDIDMYILANCITAVFLIIFVAPLTKNSEILKIIFNLICFFMIAFFLANFFENIKYLFNLSIFNHNNQINMTFKKDLSTNVVYSNTFIYYCFFYLKIDDIAYKLYSIKTTIMPINDLSKLLIIIIYLTAVIFWMLINVYSILLSIYDICYNSNKVNKLIKIIINFRIHNIQFFFIRNYLVKKGCINKNFKISHIIFMPFDTLLLLVNFIIAILIYFVNTLFYSLKKFTILVFKKKKNKNEYQPLYSLLRVSIIISSLLTILLFIYYIHDQLSSQGYELLNIIVGVIIIPTIFVQLQDHKKFTA